jgi:hypothetical protein
MAATRASRKLSRAHTPASDGILATAARTLGHAAGAAAKAIGLDQPDSGAGGARAKSKHSRTKTLKRVTPRVHRTNQADQAKAAAKNLFPKGLAELGAPYRRVMGKPTANWTEKDLEYVNGLVAKHGK